MTAILELVLMPAVVPLLINILINLVEHWTNPGEDSHNRAIYAEAGEAGSQNIQQEQTTRT